MATNQPSANPSTGETKPSPAQQPGILPISVEMIALQTNEETHDGDLAAVQSNGSGDAGGAIKEASAPGAAQQEGMANTKESTPMGLLNLVARYNNMKPNYELMHEEGPAHQKIFSVQLAFGEERYKGSGTSIKRAQHNAAQKALDNCKLPTPERKEKPAGYKLIRSPNKNALTPTVQLNSYSLKTGVTVDYAVLNAYPAYPPGGYRRPPYNQQHRYSNNTTAPPQGGGDANPKDQEANTMNTFHGEPRQGSPAQFTGPPPPIGGVGPRPRGPRGPGPHHYNNYMHYPPYDMRPMYRQRFRRPFKQVFSVQLTVGNREFVGQGANQRLARQDAAAKAMKSLEDNPIPVKKDQATSMLENDPKETPVSASGDASNNNKSEISQVYEVANFNQLNLEFKVLDESGPPHQKEYKIECTVGNITVMEMGSSKKEAKRKAAAAVLPKLKSLPPPTKTYRQAPRMGWKPSFKKSTINKKSAEDTDFGSVGMNPISRLVQICQAKKMKDPFFEVLNDQPIPDRRVHPTVYRHIFTMQVSVGDKNAEGKGSTKKEAKKEAAEAMLILMGYKPSHPDTPVPIPGADATPGKPALKQPQDNREVKKEEESQNSDRKVTFQDDQVKGTTLPVKKEEEVEKPEMIPGSQQGSQIPGITPGLFPMMPGIKPIQPPFQQQAPVQQPPAQALNRAPGAPVSTPISAPRKTFNPALTADIASELLLTQRSLTAQTILQSNNVPIQLQSSRPQHMLEYMGSVTGLDVAFNDYPQSSQNEYLTEVRISTEPPVVFHGTAQTIDAAHDLAALNILRALAGCPPEEGNRVVAQNRSLVQGIGINSQ